MYFEGNSVDRHVYRYYYNRGVRHVCGVMSHLLTTQLTQRFGSLPDGARMRIEDADIQLLTHWSERLLSAASLDDVLNSVP